MISMETIQAHIDTLEETQTRLCAEIRDLTHRDIGSESICALMQRVERFAQSNANLEAYRELLHQAKSSAGSVEALKAGILHKIDAINGRGDGKEEQFLNNLQAAALLEMVQAYF